jgi:predicted translin family RNA/ssDNA-binding protein
MFEGFRDELDEHHDRRERIIKASRDITAASKKIIFALQRVRDLGRPLPPAIAKTVATHAAAIDKLLATVAPDLAGINRHRYAGQMLGLEELVEALALARYLTAQTLVRPEDVVAGGGKEEASSGGEAGNGLVLALPAGLELTRRDYLGGIMDLFGEMMRFATVLASGDASTTAMVGGSGEGARRTILTDMHELGGRVEGLPHIAVTGLGGFLFIEGFKTRAQWWQR